jgi:hypothetical protein
MMMGSVSRATARHFRNARKFLFIQGILMNARKSFATALVAWAPMLALLSIGCRGSSSSSSVDPKGEAIHIHQAASHVGKYMADNKGKVPKDTGEMKDWAAKNNIPEDEILSTRDHEPYEVHEVAKGTMKELIVTEKTGAKGRKFMWTSRGHTPLGMEVGQEEIDSAIKASPGRPGG